MSIVHFHSAREEWFRTRSRAIKFMCCGAASRQRRREFVFHEGDDDEWREAQHEMLAQMDVEVA
eukprot:CAMPEP_0119090648 /NCGR_PEP_ID=MMETSP1178-20130426/153506_1 /TAXON_ID=33656 /ORGANISM="unid sp, Strain CCMP2000" /LENGTH=63 /DNA_ID=CAMNT_0007074095 /DNA_START=117 /DNA_END=305 /DNA_ORIENTATION=-